MKYQLSIRTGKSGDKNSAATKAVLDCNTLFAQRGYVDYSLVIPEQAGKVSYYLSIFKTLLRFYFKLEKNSSVGVQYPMLNNVFKYFMKAGKKKRVKFFCIIHDIESLRLGGTDAQAVKLEAANLSFYDCVIVHNNQMLEWLKDKGCVTKMVSLGVFDYLSNFTPASDFKPTSKSIAFAGNLTKSYFIYSLEKVGDWNFNVYGPNFKAGEVKGGNVTWGGEFSPTQIVSELKGDFGLIWDGETIEKCDDILGNYLKYNNPHKFSLYLAAGLPVIAPVNSAIAEMIKEHKLGILVNSLSELNDLQVNEAEYKIMKQNTIEIGIGIRNGSNFLAALEKAEQLVN